MKPVQDSSSVCLFLCSLCYLLFDCMVPAKAKLGASGGANGLRVAGRTDVA